MDRIDIVKKAKEQLGKYKYVLLILCIGILLMSLPDGTETPVQQEQVLPQDEQETQAEKLEEILSQISGVGKVKVLLTEAAGEEMVYQTNEDRSNSGESESIRIETVIITDSDKDERGLIRTVVPPVYLGAIIVCQGGDSPAVKLSIVQAVSSVTGISSERITVLKMK